MLAFDRPPYGLAERPLSWGGPGQALQFNPYTTEGNARLTIGGHTPRLQPCSSSMQLGHPQFSLYDREHALLWGAWLTNGNVSGAGRRRGTPPHGAAVASANQACIWGSDGTRPAASALNSPNPQPPLHTQPQAPSPSTPSGLLDALGVGPVVAVGHSAGALVCMELAQRQPHRVAGKRAPRCSARWPNGRGTVKARGMQKQHALRGVVQPPRGRSWQRPRACPAALPPAARAALGFVAPALPTAPGSGWLRTTLGAQLRFLLTRAVLANDRLGLR